MSPEEWLASQNQKPQAVMSPEEWMASQASAPKLIGERVSASESIRRGMMDPIDAGAQMLYNALPAGVQRAGNRLNNALAQYGIVAPVPEGGADQMVRDANRAYEARRKDAGQTGIDWARLGGNIVSPANLAVAARLPQAVSTTGRMGAGVLGGALGGMLQPATSDDQSFLEEKARQGLAGAVGGAVVPAVVAGVGRVISPAASTNPQNQLLRQEGIRPTIGQSLGGMANRLEEKAVSLPFVGDAIAAARRRAAEDLNAAVANRALEPIGQKLPAGLQGREAVAHVKSALSDAYDSILPKMIVKADPAFGQEIGALRQMVNTGSMDPKAAGLFNRIMQNDVLGKFKGQKVLTGETLKQIEGDLSAQIGRLQQSTDADHRLVANALREAQDSLRNLVARNNPQMAEQLGRINQGYANFKRLERAAGYVGAEDGLFSPGNLQSAVKALDKSKDKGKFARGAALMQDLSDAAKARLGDKIPNSGTADRLASGGVLASGFLNPAIPASFLGGAALYSNPAQSLLRGTVMFRPSFAQPVAGLLNQSAPMFSPAGGLLAADLLQQ